MTVDVLPPVVVWPYAAVFWATFVWAMMPEWRLIGRTRAEAAAGPQDAGSCRVIVVVNMLAVGLAFALAFGSPATAMSSHRMAAFWTGVALLAGGSALRRHCFAMLGASFTGAVEVRPGQIVVERGAYRRVRHPSYTAGILMFAGIGLALASWLSLLLMTLAPVFAYAYRVRVEERALAETLGEPYRAYMRRTKRFVPFIV